MRTFSKLISLSLIVLLTISLVSAQDAENLRYSEDTSGVMVIAVEDGTFAENDDDTWTFTITASAEFSSVFISEPSVSIQNYTLSELSDDWSFATDLLGSSFLQTQDRIFRLTLSVPSFDLESGQISFIVTEASGRITTESKASAIPAQITSGSLYITLDADFLNTLGAGREERLAQFRDTGDTDGCPCDP